MEHKKLYNFLLVLFLIPILGFAIWCGSNVYKLSAQRAAIKKDYSEINNIRYGLLSMDTWRDNIVDIVNSQIEDFNLSDPQRDSLKVELNGVLNSLVTQAFAMINEKQKTIGGKLKKFAVNTFVNVDKIRARVPEFTNTIIKQIEKPQSKERLRFLAQDKLKDLSAKTHDNLHDKQSFDIILKKYNVADLKSFNDTVPAKIYLLQENTYKYAFELVACLVLFLILWVIFWHKKHLYTSLFIMSVLLALAVLFVGLCSPMIEIDARIKELNFSIIGKHVIFDNQVIFYQSKSILDVVHILISTGKYDSIFVGVLILVFSIMFPITKLICAKIYLLGNEKWRASGFIKFFAFKSGKWSMADVMVVAIFMAYVGFKGIFDNQMESLNMHTNSLSSIATNQTSLQPGFILFVSYVLFGLVLAVILKRITFKKPIGTDFKYFVSKLRKKKMSVLEIKPTEGNQTI
ncbi:MAG: paraquat-inducible protein A [Bacteroidia bacterium]